MPTLLRISTTLLLVLAVSATGLAEEKKADKAKNKGRRDRTAAVRVPAGVELDAAQKEKLAELQTQYGPKLAELQKKSREAVPAEQRKARREAQRAARAAGKKGRELRQAVDAAVPLSEEQQTKLAEVQKERRALQQEILAALSTILTEEQRAKLDQPRKPREKKAGAKKAEKKPAAKKTAAETKDEA